MVEVKRQNLIEVNRGSEWGRWDLHYHSFGTHLNNQFQIHGKNKDSYLKDIEESEIEVFGITDYFTADDVYQTIKDFKDKYPNSRKVLFPNIEFRLDTNVSKDPSGHANIHLIFDNNLDQEKVKGFINSLPLTQTSEYGTHKKIGDLKVAKDFRSATIKISELQEKLKENFGTEKPFLIFAAGSGYGGIRPYISKDEGTTRNGQLADELDKASDCIFADKQAVEYYLSPARYKKAMPKPCLLGSDYHGENSNNQLDKFSWIKSSKTFEGLRQIIFEPEGRVQLCIQCPDQKLGYQVIDFVELSNGKKIYFNSALNTIIGGRSTGKSTLTNSIAQLTRNKNFSLLDKETGRGMNTFNKNIWLGWRDGQQHEDLEFLPQDYMIIVAEDNKKRNELIKETVKSDSESYSKIELFEKRVVDTQKKVNELLTTWEALEGKLSALVKPEGDKKGIETQIDKYNNEIINQKQKSKLTDQENEKYKQIESDLNRSLHEKQIAVNNISHLHDIENRTLNVSIELSDIDDIELVNSLKEYIILLENEVNNKWQVKLKELLKLQVEYQDKNEAKISTIKESSFFKRVQDDISNNEVLSKLEDQLAIEIEKLKKILQYDKNISNIKEQIDTVKKQIITTYQSIVPFRDELQQNFIVKADPVEIKMKFLPINIESKIWYLDRRNNLSTQFINAFNKNANEKINSIFSGLNLSYNQMKTENDFIKDVLSQRWFNIEYTLQYDGDSFNQMSQGKKAFVILTLILEFSKDKKPVIIDQPEDSLDNRAIYKDLTQYLKRKKNERQIILVTHNPNIVVGADAENVIVANQDSEDLPNENNDKFAYINGPLENSGTQKSKYALRKQGIRQHVLEILEGGREAFEKREAKYK